MIETVSMTADETAIGDKIAKVKAAKSEAAKRFKERRAEEAKERVENAQKLIEQLKNQKVWEKLSKEAHEFLESLATVKVNNSGNGGLFQQLFGDNPKVGDSITLIDAFNKTFKGLAPLQKYCKVWAEKGTIVEFKQAAKMQDSTFTIKALAK